MQVYLFAKKFSGACIEVNEVSPVHMTKTHAGFNHHLIHLAIPVTIIRCNLNRMFVHQHSPVHRLKIVQPDESARL